jgi:hypothetical protein
MPESRRKYEEIGEWSHEAVEQALRDDDTDALLRAVSAFRCTTMIGVMHRICASDFPRTLTSTCAAMLCLGSVTSPEFIGNSTGRWCSRLSGRRYAMKVITFVGRLTVRGTTQHFF